MTTFFIFLVIAGALLTVGSLNLQQSQKVRETALLAQKERAAETSRIAEYQRTPTGRVIASLNQLSQYAAEYEGYNVYPKIARIAKDMNELLKRLEVRGTPQQFRIAQTQYADILEKTVMCISPTYLKDIIDNPRYWQHSEKRLADVESVLDAVPAQIVENIKQVNSSTDLDFQTALAVLNNIADDAEITALYESSIN